MDSVSPILSFDAAADVSEHLSKSSVDCVISRLESLRMPGAVYRSTGDLIFSNDSFLREFEHVAWQKNIREFMQDIKWVQGSQLVSSTDIVAALFSEVPILTHCIDEWGVEKNLPYNPKRMKVICLKTFRIYIFHWFAVGELGELGALRKIEEIGERSATSILLIVKSISASESFNDE
ncbi:MAG: hypothetical protein KUG82_14190 [Pseudomonadales bacterium]|nr:hypothetical protein [Pseudomonadales bacterium]